MAKILLVDDNPQNIELLSLRLDAAGHRTVEAKNGEEALRLVVGEAPDLMILDMQMPKLDGLAVLKRLKEDRIDIPVVVISAFATVERAVEAMKAGAFDFITKPFDPTHLELVVERALERTSLRHQNRFLTEELNARYHFVLGKSAQMVRAYESMIRTAPENVPVLIRGEGGTGKEVAARVIHKESGRRGAFINVCCAALSPQQLQEELFGTLERKGKVEMAGAGTLFLDEVGMLPAGIQQRLAQLIVSHGITRTGGSTPILVDVRVVAATTCDLAEKVTGGAFLKDLFDLFPVRITLPPLRERREDIPELVEYFVEKYKREVGRPLDGVSEPAMALLANYRWPGNVRELANIIERAVSTGQGDQIGPGDLGISRGGDTAAMAQVPEIFTGTYPQALKACRRQVILAALREAQGDTSAAAARLGFSAARLDRLMKLLEIRR